MSSVRCISLLLPIAIIKSFDYRAKEKASKWSATTRPRVNNSFLFDLPPNVAVYRLAVCGRQTTPLHTTYRGLQARPHSPCLDPT